MKRILLIFTLLSLIISVTSCKKDEAATDDVTIADLTGSYVSSDKAIVKPAEMYTKSGFTRDYNTIKAFLEKKQEQQQYEVVKINTSSEEVVDANLCNLTIEKGKGKVDIAGLLSTARTKFEGEIKDFSKDELSIVSTVDTNFIQYYYLSPSTIIKPIAPADIFIPVATSTGITGGQLIAAKKTRFVIIGKDIYFPKLRLSTWLKESGGGYSSSTAEGIYGVINPNLLNELQDGEEVVVQQILVKMIKQ